MSIKKELFKVIVYSITSFVGVFYLMFDYLQIYFLFLICYSYYIKDI